MTKVRAIQLIRYYVMEFLEQPEDTWRLSMLPERCFKREACIIAAENIQKSDKDPVTTLKEYAKTLDGFVKKAPEKTKFMLECSAQAVEELLEVIEDVEVTI